MTTDSGTSASFFEKIFPGAVSKQPLGFTKSAIALILNLYLILLCAALPLYMPKHYLALGEQKFLFYRVITIAALVPSVLLMLFSREDRGEASVAPKEHGKRLFSADVLVLICAAAQLFCFFLSKDRAISLFGTDGWRDGFFTEITFLLLLWFYAHYFVPVRGLPYLLLVGPLIVYLLTFRQVLHTEADEIAFFATIGHGNWYAGFLSVILPLCAGVFFCGKDRKRTATLYLFLCLLLSAVAAVIQGSSSILLSVFVLVWLVLLYRLREMKNEKVSTASQRCFHASLLLTVPVSVGVLLLQICYPFSPEFGTYRGLIWNAAGKILASLSPAEWLFGTGQDTFYALISADAELSGLFIEVFPDVRVTNAHAELFNLLITQGLAGLCSFLLLVFFVLRRLSEKIREKCYPFALPCALIIVSYFANNLVSFRQILSTPLFYVFLGIGYGFY